MSLKTIQKELADATQTSKNGRSCRIQLCRPCRATLGGCIDIEDNILRILGNDSHSFCVTYVKTHEDNMWCHAQPPRIKKITTPASLVNFTVGLGRKEVYSNRNSDPANGVMSLARSAVQLCHTLF
jgi:hypothetical protein